MIIGANYSRAERALTLTPYRAGATLMPPKEARDMLAVGIGPIGPFEGMIILLVIVLIFGVGKLSDVGGALGKSVREFRKAAREPDEPEQPQTAASTSKTDATRPGE
jgi:sec-independent protein translocase protein TatA